MDNSSWPQFNAQILDFEKEGLVTRTFRRLDPERQQAVLQAILEEAGEVGPVSLNIKRVATRAGVSVGSLYQYFRSRAGLMSFAVALCVRRLTDLFDQSKPYLVGMPLREAISAYLTYGLEWGRGQGGLIRFFGRAAYQGDPTLTDAVVRPVATAMRELVQAMLEAAARRCELRPSLDLDAVTRAVNTWLIALGDSQLFPFLNQYFQVSADDAPFEKCLQAVLDILVRGLTVPGGVK